MPAHVASTVNAITYTAQDPWTATRTIPAGALVVCPVKWENTETLDDFFSSVGGTWAIAGQRAHADGPSKPIGAIAYCLSHPGGSNVVHSADFSAVPSAIIEMNVMVFTPDSGKTFAYEDFTSDEGTGLTFSAPDLDVTGPGVVVQWLCGFQFATGVVAGGSPAFTRDTDTENGSGTTFAQYLIHDGSDTTITPGASWGALGAKWVFMAAAFKQVDAGGGGGFKPQYARLANQGLT